MGVTLALLPEVVLSLAALGVLLVNAWRHETAADARLAGWLSLGGVGASLLALAWLWGTASDTAGIPQMVALDGYRYVGTGLLRRRATISVARFIPERGDSGPELHLILLPRR
jgi:NADH:ubiquinone oxidoreductase subunit 2 (subunit N)